MCKPISFAVCAAATLLFCIACNTGTKPAENQPDTLSVDPAPVVRTKIDTQQMRVAVIAANQQILQLLHNKAYEKLPAWVHPVKGVRFSMAGYVDTAKDQGFSPERLQNYLTTQKARKLVWGTDMDTDSIRMTVPEYLAKEVYRKNFLHADSIGYNIIYQTGSTLKVMEAVYGHAPFVSNHFFGNQEKYGGMDWQALRLVFDRYQEKYYLVGIINDEWTP